MIARSCARYLGMWRLRKWLRSGSVCSGQKFAIAGAWWEMICTKIVLSELKSWRSWRSKSGLLNIPGMRRVPVE